MHLLKHQLKNFVDKVPTMKEDWLQWELNWLNSSFVPMIGTPTIEVHQVDIEAKDLMTQAIVIIGGVLHDLQVNMVQATTTLLHELRAMNPIMMLPQELRIMGLNLTQLQDLRVMDHNMTTLQDLRTTLRVAMTPCQGLHTKDPSIMILRQELHVMQDKKM